MTNIPKHIARWISGNRTSFPLGYRLFNIASFSVGVVYALSFVWILFVSNSDLLKTLIFTNTFVYLLLFFMARFKKKKLPLLFFIYSLISLSINWVFFGGVEGSAPIAYLFLTVLFLIISLRKYHIYILILVLINVLALYSLDIAKPFPDQTTGHITILSTFLIAMLVVSLTITLLKKSYREEQGLLEEQEKSIHNLLKQAAKKNNDLKRARENAQQNVEKLQASANNLENVTKQLDAQRIALERSTLLSMIDLKGNFISVNEQLSHIIQLREEELIGKSYRSILHPEASHFLKEMLSKLNARKTWTGTIKGQNQVGEPYWLKSIIMPIPDPEGGISHFMAISTDITNEILLQEQERWQAVLYRILQISMEDLPVKKMLTKCLDELFAISWLKIRAKGGFFLTGGTPYLKRITHKGLDEYPTFLEISDVGNPMGLAAYFHQIIFVDGDLEKKQAVLTSNNGTDEESQTLQLSKEHHFVVPIVWGGKLLGVLVLYIAHLQVKKDAKIEFLTSIATSLAGVLKRKQAEEALKTHTKKLEIFNDEVLKAREFAESQNQKILDSIRYAKRIQDAMLLKTERIQDFYKDIFILFKPKDIVSGDFYWFAEKANQKILVAADCTGHGVPGAFMTIMGNVFLDEIVKTYGITEPEDILSILDVKISAIFKKQNTEHMNARDGMDIAVLVIDKSDQRLSFAGAKNPLYYVRNQEIHEVKATRLSIGGAGKIKDKQFDLFEMLIEPEDTFYIFSDGFQDQFGEESGRKYLKKRFRELLVSIHQLPMQKQSQVLEDELVAWKGNQKQTDDILVIGIKS